MKVRRLRRAVAFLASALLAASCAGESTSRERAHVPQSLATPPAPMVASNAQPATLVVSGAHAAIAGELLGPLIAPLLAVDPAPLPPAPSPPGRTESAQPQYTVVLDPGHGGPDDVGAARGAVVEKASNLDMALRVKSLLQAEGVRVVLTREADTRAIGFPAGGTVVPGFSASRLDLQARVDRANAAAADLFVSIHSNGSTDPGQSGVEVWYDPARPFGADNRAFADLALARVLGSLLDYGYKAVDRGLKDDSCFRSFAGRCRPLFVLGPPRETTREEVIRRGGDPAAIGFLPDQDVIVGRATAMPGVLVELLFISNESDNRVLQSEKGRDAIAGGLASAVLEFLRRNEP